jgi:hypothetical protein
MSIIEERLLRPANWRKGRKGKTWGNISSASPKRTGRQQDAHEGLQQPLDLLEVRHVSRSSDEGVVADLVQTLDVLETSEGSIRGCRRRVTVSLRTEGEVRGEDMTDQGCRQRA